ncbi:uncharacterized protein NESG_02372 [Nematocida ausubeli]|uniref:Uncharacterized protein n=1 Tax=Nematocida ausubeli (strain ATCC PRA-371 / ERTm2) TaxID=1913371 RepID=H8ZCW3_NEMA1|nr:uncharacterized protein NESG_02372 [Nematocida ausubeli]EHY65503.1 hypothetical protein NERG_01110 [Nematocida ausubeli]KAI5134253.1 hypothetical protein NEAUS06_1002 [Nematocida ausubeli]KAI5137031.1 hypothetical protein NEAUS07_1780 [Nematocida ausubeli]KFG25152.1 hypothetical protein NESG_02372 [Nematocida ausubeli]
MKYLELESTTTGIAGDIIEIKENAPGLNILFETYSLKMTRQERKTSRSGKYKSLSLMVTAALNLLFVDYDVRITYKDLKIISKEECKADLTNKLFTIGLTKSYQEMAGWVESVFRTIQECAGSDADIIKVETRKGPFAQCHWSECLAVHGRSLKRVVLFVVLYSNHLNSPILL